MLRLILDGKEAWLPADTQVGLSLNNPPFEEREKDATYPITLPIGPNRHIFGFPDRIVNISFKTELPAILLEDAQVLLNGIASVTSISASEVELYISTYYTTFWGKPGETLMNELPGLGSVSISNVGRHARWHAITFPQNFPDYDILDNVVGVTLEGDAKDYVFPRFYCGNIEYNAFDPGRRLFQSSIAPCILLHAAIRKVIEFMGYRLISDCLESEMFDRICIVHFAGTIHPELTSDNKQNITFNIADTLPAISVNTFFEEIEKKFNITFYINENAKTIILQKNSIPAETKSVAIEDDFIKNCDPDIATEKQTTAKKYLDKLPDGESFVSPFSETTQTYLAGAEDSANIEEIACISYPLGYDYKNVTYNAIEPVHRIEYVERQINLQILKSSLAITDNSLRLAEIQIRTSEGYEESEDFTKREVFYEGCSTSRLTWKSLYERSHARENIKDISRYMQYEIYLHPSGNILDRLNDYFTSTLEIRGRKMIASKMELTLTNRGIDSWNLLAYPV